MVGGSCWLQTSNYIPEQMASKEVV